MKLFVVLALLAVAVSGETEEQAWIRQNRLIPGGYYVAPLRPPGSGRIVGGVDADIADYPYQLSVRLNGNHNCGASVISARWALSAAHCTFPLPELSTITLWGGSSSRIEGGALFVVDNIINHPQYNQGTLQFDVCVLHTTSDLVGANIVPIALDPTGADHAPNTRAVVSGWGLNGDGVLPIILQRTDIPIVSQDSCRVVWGSFLTDDMMCAGGEPGRDACTADSGGPLVVGGVQIGIVSWGSPACLGTSPAGYARVAYPAIRQFITDSTGV